MKLLLTLLTLVSLFTADKLQASGMTLHMWMSDLAKVKLMTYELEQLLERNKGAYRMGAIYPDTGYAAQHPYGEAAHWSPFLNEYQSILLEECPFPLNQPTCESYWAHYFGVVSHALADTNFDKNFVTASAENDFSGNIDQAQKHTDPGCDFLAILDHHKAYPVPVTEQPVDLLVQAHSNLGIDVSASTIVRGATIHRAAILGESIASPLTYLFYKWTMPWTSANYVTAPGGIEDSSLKIAHIWDYMWQQLSNGNHIVFSHKGRWPQITYKVDEMSL